MVFSLKYCVLLSEHAVLLHHKSIFFCQSMNILKNTTFVAVVSLATLVLLAYVVFGKKSETKKNELVAPKQPTKDNNV